MKNLLTFWLSIALGVLITLTVLSVQAKKWVVTVKNYSFTPYNLTHVKAHDTIQWVWESGSHSTTSTSIPPGADSWDNPINQDTISFILIPTNNGTFFYRSTPDTASIMNGQFTVTGATGVDENMGKSGFSISPNPFHNEVCIHFPDNHTSLTRVQIYNPEGKMLRSVIINPLSGATLHTIDVKDLPRGAVIFRFADESRTISVYKAIHD